MKMVELSRRPFHPSAVAACLASLLALIGSPALWAQCTDTDNDGFFYEAGCGTPQDCNDADPNTNPDAPEVCDGYDNDCDGGIDNDPGCDTTCDSPEKIGDDVGVTNDSFVSYDPDIIWNGSDEYGLVFIDDRDSEDREAFFQRLNAAGEKIGADTRMTDPPDPAGFPRLTWTGSHYGIVWHNDPGDGAVFARVDSLGTKIGDNVQVGDPGESQMSAITWTGREYGIAFEDYRDIFIFGSEIYFARIDASGVMIDEVRVTFSEPALSLSPDMVWAGSEYGLVWYGGKDGNNEIYFVRLDTSGNKIGTEVRVTNDPASSNFPRIVWTGTEFGVVWLDERDNREVYFARLDSSGTKIGSDVRVTNNPDFAQYLDIAWTGSEFGVVWAEGGEILFARLDSSGTKIGGDLRLTNDPDRPLYPSITWTGSTYGVAWSDRPDGHTEIYFVRIGCNCSTDGDGDGFFVCDDCDDLDSTIWSTPSEVQNLQFAADKETLSWTEPAEPGAPVSDLVYDTLRSEDPTDFDLGAACIESDDGSDMMAVDSEMPLPGTRFHYLVRAENACPSSEGSLGTDSGGLSRIARTCD